MIARAQRSRARSSSDRPESASPTIAGELMKLNAARDNVTMVHVPYKGGGQAMIDIMGGQIDMMFNRCHRCWRSCRAESCARRDRGPCVRAFVRRRDHGGVRVSDFYMIESWVWWRPRARLPTLRCGCGPKR
jgi:hypothetical protein